ncbi:MAG: T9SS type A sorting domain-containing protein [Saprospiraceae bacterium]|nr:T9SS type A sorting domain-containing protein [Saprospiraceae bacterium]MBX7180256.1 T9SS type A sorting domain-containing protein [Saprospiraceae bacterium]MCB0592347.1 T9SS type A sorting domain-containing protein [Saprospiraceae bacterium]MCO5284109.1 T9SS type A sorting domain-containing protein [Saprospiraceae bacterium]MCO6470912.1 T9SS type A sorting domain-containing protein [Saprospiraceae bacterium]
MNKILSCLLVLLCIYSYGQTIPQWRIADWTGVGIKKPMNDDRVLLRIADFGGLGNGTTSNVIAWDEAISALQGKPGIIEFDQGIYLFDRIISIPSHTILRGKGAESTILRFVYPATGNLISLQGRLDDDVAFLTRDAFRNDDFIILTTTDAFNAGDLVRISMDDTGLVTSDWAKGTVGQIIEIKDQRHDTLFLSEQLRLDLPLQRQPVIRKIDPVKYAGIECLKIVRGSNDAFQSNNISLEFASNCLINGVESDSANLAHIAVSSSSHVEVRNCYLHDSYDYGGGGKGYGILVQATSGDCLIENNIFKHLRHSMILQAGANGNVFGYNYSIEPYWTGTTLPSNASGDLVLHGNYVFSNLFEGNIGQQIVIDDSHGINGPFNTFFRNRLESYGIFMNNNPPSDSQNLVGNEVTSTVFTQGLYLLFGKDHFQYGNNIRGSITPVGTEELSDTSYYLTKKPPFLDDISQYPIIGTPNVFKSGKNSAAFNFTNGIFTRCGDDVISGNQSISEREVSVALYPNPTRGNFIINGLKPGLGIRLYDIMGKLIFQQEVVNACINIDLSGFNNGLYFVNIMAAGGIVQTLKIVKMN